MRGERGETATTGEVTIASVRETDEMTTGEGIGEEMTGIATGEGTTSTQTGAATTDGETLTAGTTATANLVSRASPRRRKRLRRRLLRMERL